MTTEGQLAKDTRIEDLQSVSQQVLLGAARIQELELAKRHLKPGSRRFHELSDEIERLSADVRLTSHAETDLARRLEGEKDLPTVAEADEQATR